MAGFLRKTLVAVLLASAAVAQPQHEEHPEGRVDALELACEGKSSGDECQAVTANNRTIEGECFTGAPPGVEHAPPLHCRIAHPGEVACRKKSEKDECTFSRPGDDQTTKGQCFKTPHGSMMCRMGDPEDPESRDDNGFLPPHLACQNLTVGDECKTHGPGNTGVCTALPGTSDVVHCRMIMPSEKACMKKSEDDDCTFERPGPDSDDEETGKCVKMGRRDTDVLVCRPDGPGGHIRLSSMTEAQQQEFETKQQRLREIREIPNFRNNETLFEEYKGLKAFVRETRDKVDAPAAAEAISVAGRMLRGSD
eukprot:CAMPEP_0195524970 /NCGR_PEP_ID=MMETSP0794_2-20130614/25118_1 /TAXON_ID=515487 /ORGANISM="Stephanopyxis turris, Strain CCMP 815" /LENGTH=308 /DNA_ID=CAMNT_0040655319 /DNA_START=75 /DNA_END=1001 /DNA_ORIENTATION=+